MKFWLKTSVKLCLPVVSANAPHNGETINVIAGVIAPRNPICASKMAK
jgi:hypothetical protein